MIKINSNIHISQAIRWAIDSLKLELEKKNIGDDFTLELGARHQEDGARDGDEKGAMDGAWHQSWHQSYERSIKGDTVVISASDDAGFMYGILDLSRDMVHNNGLKGLKDTKVRPYIKNRGIKFNIPLDARTPSYSDNSDSAFNNIENMWDFSFWAEFLDRMAMDRYNTLSLWSLSPFPSLVRIKKYPQVALDDVKKSLRPIKADLSGWGMYDHDMEDSLVTVKKMTMDEKIAFWRSVMEYAHNRCIKIFLFTWNLFIYGTEGNPYGITCDQTNPITKDYLYHAVYDLMDTYPLLAGIGITSGENMLRNETDIYFLSDTYGRAVRDYLAEHPGRDFRFIHRMHYAGYKYIVSEYKDFPCPFEISFKYSQAHMYSSTKPSFIDDFLKEKDKDHKLWLTVRNDDFYMYRWGNPEFAREYLKNMPIETMTGFYMGADGYTWGRDYIDLRDDSHPLYITKMWYMFRIWGQLSYRVDLPNDYFVNELKSYFGMDASKLYEVWKEASQIIAELNRVHWHDYDFQWYPEGCCMYDFEKDKLVFADINEFISCRSMPGEDVYSVKEYCQAIIEGKEIVKTSPLTMADRIYDHAKKAVAGAENIRAKSCNNRELEFTLDDIEALGYLGYYYSAKLNAAVSLCLYRMNHIEKYRKEAEELLKIAADHWISYSSKSKEMYRSQKLDRLCSYVDVQRFDKLAILDIKYAEEKL